MPKFPRKPQTGDKVLQALYDSICQIIDYLPSLEVRGDNATTSVNHTEYGTIIKSIKPNNVITQSKKGGEGGQQYYADNESLTLNPTTNVFSIKPPADTSKNYTLGYLSGIGFVWLQMEDC